MKIRYLICGVFALLTAFSAWSAPAMRYTGIFTGTLSSGIIATNIQLWGGVSTINSVAALETDGLDMDFQSQDGGAMDMIAAGKGGDLLFTSGTGGAGGGYGGDVTFNSGIGLDGGQDGHITFKASNGTWPGNIYFNNTVGAASGWITFGTSDITTAPARIAASPIGFQLLGPDGNYYTLQVNLEGALPAVEVILYGP